MVSRFFHRRRASALGCSVIFAGSVLCVSNAQAQDAEQTVAGSQVEEVLVTGSRIAREGIDSSTPVTIIGVEDIKLSGVANVEKVLSDAPQFVGSTNGGASANTVPGGTSRSAPTSTAPARVCASVRPHPPGRSPRSPAPVSGAVSSSVVVLLGCVVLAGCGEEPPDHQQLAGALRAVGEDQPRGGDRGQQRHGEEVGHRHGAGSHGACPGLRPVGGVATRPHPIMVCLSRLRPLYQPTAHSLCNPLDLYAPPSDCFSLKPGRFISALPTR